MSQASREGRSGDVFSVRVTAEQRKALEAAHARAHGAPRYLGPFLVWSVLAKARGTTGALGTTAPGGRHRGSTAAIARASGTTVSSSASAVVPKKIPVKNRVIVDLCAGSGAWSEPYKRAGYRVVRVSWPRLDVRTWRPPPRSRVWGILAAPPCTEFSLAKNGSARDLAEGMACVNAVYRIVAQCAPMWWALENPVGLLSGILGTPRDVFEPCDFGDPWTKRTALWGSFERPERGPYVKPIGGKLRIVRGADERAVTPPGFARAFFEANP